MKMQKKKKKKKVKKKSRDVLHRYRQIKNSQSQSKKNHIG